jgi:hypothetical protein
MKLLLSTLVAGLFLAGVADAQCALPDGLQGPCCADADANLPAFPPYQMQGSALQFQACQPVAQPCVRWEFQAPAPKTCDQLALSTRVSDCNGVPLLQGEVQLDYTRTWMEALPDGQLQVWRFAAKGQLSLVAGAQPQPAIVPPSAVALPSIFYYGYVEYARHCQSGQWEMVSVLLHQCDHFIHGGPAFTATPGVYHPGSSFALVGPDTAANPFVPAFAPAPGGAVVDEALRTVAQQQGPCHTEESIVGLLQVIGAACLCPPMVMPPQITARRLEVDGECGSQLASLDLLSSGLPWLHLLSTSIGTWTTANAYPGPERVWLDEGPVLRTEPCAPDGVPAVFAEILYGATTAGGFPILPQLGQPNWSNRTDLASNFSWRLGTPFNPPLVGTVMPTRKVLYLTVP